MTDAGHVVYDDCTYLTARFGGHAPMRITSQPSAEELAAARHRLGCTQKALADQLSTRGVPCSSYTVERWETTTARRHRNVPEHIWPELRDILGVTDVPVAASNEPVGRDCRPEAVRAAPMPRLASLLRQARPETCLQVCRCPRYECVRCGTLLVGNREAGQHVCSAIAFLLAPSDELLAVLADRDADQEGVA